MKPEKNDNRNESWIYLYTSIFQVVFGALTNAYEAFLLSLFSGFDFILTFSLRRFYSDQFQFVTVTGRRLTHTFKRSKNTRMLFMFLF